MPTFADRHHPSNRKCMFAYVYVTCHFSSIPPATIMSATCGTVVVHRLLSPSNVGLHGPLTLKFSFATNYIGQRGKHGLPLYTIGTSGPELFAPGILFFGRVQGYERLSTAFPTCSLDSGIPVNNICLYRYTFNHLRALCPTGVGPSSRRLSLAEDLRP